MSDWSRRTLLVCAGGSVLAIGLGCGRKQTTISGVEKHFMQREAVRQGEADGILGDTVTVKLVSGEQYVGRLGDVTPETLVLVEAVLEQRLEIPLEQLLWLRYYEVTYSRVEVNEAARAAGRALGVLGGFVLVLFLVLLIVLASKGSCPFVYVVDPKTGERRLWGEAYSGAVVKSLARADRMALPPVEGDTLDLVLANEAPETQFTDAAWLEVVAHATDERIVASHRAELLRVGGSVAPEHLADLTGREVTPRPEVGAWMSDLFLALDEQPRPSREGWVARFSNTPRAPAVEIVLRNSPWLDRVSMLAWAALGDEALTDLQRKAARPIATSRARTLMEQGGVHARLEVRQGGAWTLVDHLRPPGWVGDRRIVVPLEDVVPGAPIEVRLTGGIGFLMVSEMALTTVLGPAEATVVAPHVARQSTGDDERARLAAVDDDPNVLEALHESVALTFGVPEAPEGEVRSLFLHAHGYYEVHPPADLVAPPEAAAALEDPTRFGVVSLDVFEAEFAALAAGGR
ncbi:MAG: hypothetical protein EP330_23270 [Deltaproteobacteria bacterium]|nr:MAG: hypothetical protein EP330_23270 [Deltaproteobacteria bacterium]